MTATYQLPNTVSVTDYRHEPLPQGSVLEDRVRLTVQKWKRWFLLLACAFLVKHMKLEMLAKENFFGNPTALQLKLGAVFTISENTEIVARLTIKGQQRWRSALATHAIYNSPSR